MALLKCPDCGKMVSERAAACPDCGCPREYFESTEIIQEKKETEKQELPKGAIEYCIADKKIVTLQEDENTAFFSKMYEEIAMTCCNQLKTKFYGLKSLEDIVEKINDIAENYFQYAFDETERYFKTHGVYGVDKNIFLQKYYTGAATWDDVYEYIYSQYAEITGKLEELKAYREARKASRGRVVAFGFTFKGYLKGAVQAGAINMATGLAHSIFNSLGNSISDAIAESKLKRIYNDPMTEQMIIAALYDSIVHMKFDVMNALNRESNIKCKIITTDEVNRSNAMVKAAKSQPQEAKINVLIEAIKTNFFNTQAYIELIKCVPSESFNIEALASHFGINLAQAKVQTIIGKLKEMNSLISVMAVATKKPYTNLLGLNEKYDELCELIKFSNWSEAELNTHIEGFSAIRDRMWNQLLEVEAVRFESKDVALSVAEELEMFYNNTEELDLTSSSEIERVRGTFVTYKAIQKYCPELLEQKLERKIVLNDPKNLPAELAKICWKPELAKGVQDKFILKGLSKDFDKKLEGIVKAIPEISASDIIAVIMISGKKGYVISDKIFYSYEFSALSFKNKLEKMEKWEILNVETITSERQSIKIIVFDEKTQKKKFDYKHCPLDEKEVSVIAETLNFSAIFLQNK